MNLINVCDGLKFRTTQFLNFKKGWFIYQYLTLETETRRIFTRISISFVCQWTDPRRDDCE